MPVLWYIHDPMCSWCWGFVQAWQRLQQQLPDNIEIRYLLGGLAPDSGQPMPMDMQANIRDTWRAIQKEIPGTEFNFNFWTQCRPRRSTWPACRAVIAARQQDPGMELPMIHAIQQAYYLEARNPSDTDTLAALAADLGLDRNRFGQGLEARQTQDILDAEIQHSRKLGAQGFPSLVLENADGSVKFIPLDYNNASTMLDRILQAG